VALPISESEPEPEPTYVSEYTDALDSSVNDEGVISTQRSVSQLWQSSPINTLGWIELH
jgi:hypothetical protein